MRYLQSSTPFILSKPECPPIDYPLTHLRGTDEDQDFATPKSGMAIAAIIN